jgi:hypothetical protein
MLVEIKVLTPASVIIAVCLSEARTLIYTSICHYCCVPVRSQNFDLHQHVIIAVCLSQARTLIMTDAGVIQSSGLGQARKWQD